MGCGEGGTPTTNARVDSPIEKRQDPEGAGELAHTGARHRRVRRDEAETLQHRARQSSELDRPCRCPAFARRL